MAKFCPNCGKEMQEGADVCVDCGKIANNTTPKNNQEKKKKMPTWLIVVLVIIGIGIIGSVMSNDEEKATNNTSTNNSSTNTSTTQQTIEYIKVSKDQLDEALKNNAASAKDTYNKKYLEITGKLGTIDSDLKYISLMSSTNEWDFNGIHCYLKTSEQKNIVKTLTNGQEITIRGKITDVGEVLGYYLDIKEIIPN